MDTRQRTVSGHNSYNQRINKEEGNALAAAMKTLQQKIATLEQEKKELSAIRRDQSEEKIDERSKIEREIKTLTTILKEKEVVVSKLNQENS